MLHRARKENFPKLSVEQQSLIIVTTEHINLTGLTLPTFINTLNLIARKGYLFGISIFEKKYHKLFKDLQKPSVYETILKKMENHKNNNISREDRLKYFEPIVKSLVPQKHIREAQEIINEDLTLSSLFQDSAFIFNGHTNENVSYIILSPHRNIDRLLNKLNEGEFLKNIQDQEIWFDTVNNNLYYMGGSINLGNIRKSKEVLTALFSQDTPEKILFYQIPESSRDEFNIVEQKSYYDSFLRVLKKDIRLKKIFDLHQDRLEIRHDYIDHAH